MTVPSSGEDNEGVEESGQSTSETTPRSITIEKPAESQNNKPRRIAPKTGISPLKKGIFFVLFGCILYTLCGFFLAPLLITSLVSSSLEKKINRSVTIGSAQVNPFRFDIILKNGIIGAEKNNSDDKVDPLFSFGRLKIQLQPEALLTGKPLLQAIHGNSVFLHIVRDNDQGLNLQQLLNKATDSSAFKLKSITDQLKHVDLKLTDAKILFDDDESKASHVFSQISFRLPAGKKQGDTPYFSATINGSPIEFGNYSNQTNTGSQSFDLHLKDINLPSYLNYLPAPFPQLFSKGTADLDINLTTQQNADGFGFTISGSGLAKDIWINDGNENHNKIDSASFIFSTNLTDKKLIFTKLVLDKPELHINRSKDGQFFFPAKETFTGTTPATGLEIDTIVIKNGKLVFIDQHVPGGFGASFNEVNLSIDKNSDTNTSSYALNCTTNRKTRIASQGKITHTNWETQGLFILNNLPLAALNSYLTKPQGMTINSGIVDKFETSFSLAPLQKQKIVTLSGATGAIKNLNLNYQGKEILSFPTLKFSKAHYSQENHKATLGDLHLAGGRFHLTPNSPSLIPAHQQESQQLVWQINNFSLKNSMVHLREFPLQDKPQTIVIADLSGTNISSDPQAKAVIKTSLTMLKSATFVAEGTIQFNPLQGTLYSEIDQVALANIPAPLLSWLGPPLLGGSLSGQGTFTFPNISFTGDANIRKLKLRYGNQHDLLTIKHFKLGQLSYSHDPSQIRIKEAKLTEMHTELSISKKQLFNQADFFIPNTDAKIKAPTHVSIDTININTSLISIRDQNTQPPFGYVISQTNGTINSIDSLEKKQTNFNFTGSGHDQTKFKLDGTATLFTNNFTTNQHLIVKDSAITAMNTYLEPITGYGLQGGLFDLDIQYKEDNGMMQGETSLDVRHLTLTTEEKGNKQFPDVVALLTNSNQHIQLSIPLTSKTTDPSYTFQSAYGKKLRELILTTMVSPFSALGDYFNEKENPPNQIIFIPGSSEPEPHQKDIFLSLQTIMKNRPLLHLTLAGFSGSQEDREALLKKKQVQEEKRNQIKAIATSDVVAKNYGKELLSPASTNQSPLLPPKIIHLTKQELQDVALARCEQVKRILIEDYGIQSDIIHINITPTVVPQSDTGSQGHRVNIILSGATPK